MADDPTDTPHADPPERKWTRRRVLAAGAGGVAVIGVAGVVGLELVAHGVLPGQQRLDQIDGECSLPDTPLQFSHLGASMSGKFQSHARNRAVGYTIAYPPNHPVGSELPLVVMLHGFGANHATALSNMSPAQAMALRVNGALLAPMAMVTVDGGRGYWNPHPGDNPMAMVINELIPMCQRLGLGSPPHRIGTMGVSMGGYGALLLAEKHPHLISAVAAISPAIWTSYGQAQSANPGAYASERDFAADDAVTHATALAGVPVRVASGDGDPFHPGIVALAQALPKEAVVEFSKGCHTGAFFTEQEPPALAFLAEHLTR
jgi:pimeloyl-ACP methyl ester carboxylesterase